MRRCRIKNLKSILLRQQLCLEQGLWPRPPRLMPVRIPRQRTAVTNSRANRPLFEQATCGFSVWEESDRITSEVGFLSNLHQRLFCVADRQEMREGAPTSHLNEFLTGRGHILKNPA